LRDSLNYGADAYLIKPINFEKLISVVEKKFAKRKAEEALTVEKIALSWRLERKSCFRKLKRKSVARISLINALQVFEFFHETYIKI